VPVWDVLGVMALTVEERMKQFAELSAATPKGAARRARLRDAVQGTAHDFHGVGVEMNQRYESKAIYLADEKEARPPLPEDPILHYESTTYPGSRLPHAWVNKRTPVKAISTIGLAGHEVFCLITGIGGEGWRSASETVSGELRVGIKCVGVGWECEWEDVHGDWARRREVGESGAVLVRPDRVVAWRATEWVGDGEGKLRKVMRSILGR
jgi:hypothetical protein